MEYNNLIANKSFNFSVKIIKLYQQIQKEKKEYVLSKQILRSGTSIGANIEEAIGGYSKKDFAHKMSISYKETRETKYWLRLLHATKYIKPEEFKYLYQDADELAKMLFKIIKNSRT